MADPVHEFTVGDRVRVGGGYEGEGSAWLQGGPGYAGTIRAMLGDHAAVELDEELRLESGADWKFEDFGTGSAQALRQTDVAQGRWMTLALAWEGKAWRGDPGRLHVGLTPDEPDLNAIPKGGGNGYWVESHASVELLEAATP